MSEFLMRGPTGYVNAALIVHSVNLLPDLVEALREARPAVETAMKSFPEYPEFDSEHNKMAALLATIDALLAKATS